MWFIGVEVDQETSASRPKKNPGSAPDNNNLVITIAGSSCRPQQGIFNKLPTFYKMTLLVAMQWQWQSMWRKKIEDLKTYLLF